jgi:hypothetical protein
MLAKLTVKNQLTLPKSIVNLVGNVEYFDVNVQGGRIVLTPVRIQDANAVRDKLASLNISEEDVNDAIEWARQS